MHEFGVTETIIRRLVNQLRRDHISKVRKITFRRRSDFSEEILRQTFDLLRVDTPLANAELVVEIRVLYITCVCGYSSRVNGESLVGHIFMCPNCGSLREIDEAHELELAEVVAEIEDVPDAIQS
jgi:Zn finger protein HypA/HybF involved in hydrogenase expression